MKFINKMRKKEKGFTLVEIIVVLVILAILAAFTIPTMLGFVGDAKGKALVAEAREVYVAAQATATEYSATGILTDPTATILLNNKAVSDSSKTSTGTALVSYQMQKYLKGDLDIYNAAFTDLNVPTKTEGDAIKSKSAWAITLNADNKVTKVIYVKNGYKVTINETASGPSSSVDLLQ